MTPISFIVILSGMVLLLVSWIPFVNTLVGYVVWGAVYVMNYLVSLVESMPFSIIKGLYVSEFEFFLLLIVFVLILVFAKVKEDEVTKREQHIVIATLSVLLLFVGSLSLRIYSSERQDVMMVYSLRNHTAVDCVSGKEHVLFADSTLMADNSTVDYSLTGGWAKMGLPMRPECIDLHADFENAFVKKQANLLSYKGTLLAFWDEERLSDSLSFRIPVDFMLVTGKQKPDVASLMRGYEVGKLLVDGSVPAYLAERWKQQADEVGLPIYCLSNGALELK